MNDDVEQPNPRRGGCPMHAVANDPGMREDDTTESPVNYGSYLRIPELLELQSRRVGERSHDEMLFIVIHQAYELWFKQILHELEEVVAHIRYGDLRDAVRLMDRVLAIEDLLVKQIHLLETMTPRDFAHFRQAIRPASGLESAQFREIEFLTGLKDERLMRTHHPASPEFATLTRRFEEEDLRSVLYDRIRSEGFALPQVIDESTWGDAIQSLVPLYQDYDQHWELYQLCESLLSHDQWLLTWRFHHIRVVERIIGFKSGTGGSPGARYLEDTLDKRAFTLLIEARTHLDDDTLFARYKSPRPSGPKR